MIRGFYTAASGLLVNLRRQEAVANNLSNLNTTGYKEDAAADSSFEKVLATRVGNAPLPVPLSLQTRLGAIGTGAYQDDRRPVLKQGTLTRTGEALDLAIVGPGFFATREASGQTVYTRDGHFTTNDAGEIITSEGRVVLDANGLSITVGDANPRILRNGEVVVGEDVVGQIALYDMPADELVRADGSAFTTVGTPVLATAGSEPRLEQGQLEQSSVELAAETSRLMQASRQFEANQRLMRELAQNLEKAVTEIGRVG
ncbi:MAG: flagellar hook-basal body protein [Dehalococcoidia bacterium]|nr:flagellar hook-basal body protein [Dehalococcoidia bacterium]